MGNHQMFAYVFIYEQNTHIHVPLSSVCTDGSIKEVILQALIHLKLEEVFKESVLRVPYKKDTSKRPQETLRCSIQLFKSKKNRSGIDGRRRWERMSVLSTFNFVCPPWMAS